MRNSFGRRMTPIAFTVLLGMSVVLVFVFESSRSFIPTLYKRNHDLEARQGKDIDSNATFLNTSSISASSSESSSSDVPSSTTTSSGTTFSSTSSATSSSGGLTSSSQSSSSVTSFSTSSVSTSHSAPSSSDTTSTSATTSSESFTTSISAQPFFPSTSQSTSSVTSSSSSSTSSRVSATTSHSSSVISGSDVSPETTFTIPIQTTLSLSPFPSSSSVSPTAVVGAAVTTGFWGNKSAVAGTFSVVALIIAAICIAIAVILIRQRRRSRVALEDDISYNRYSEPDHGSPASPGPSMTELAVHAPMDPYQDRGMVYGNPEPQADQYPAEDPFARPEQDYNAYLASGITYGMGSNQGAEPMQSAPYAHDPSTDHYAPQISSSSVTHPPAAFTGSSPLTYHEHLGPHAGYRESFDSFYGGATPGQAV